MRLDILPIGQFEENSYVLHDNGHVLFIDPGRYYKKIMECVGKDEVVDGIVLTHGHSDHTGAVDDLCDVYNCPVYMDYHDLPLVLPSNAGHYGYSAPVYASIHDLNEKQVKIGTFSLEIHHTPGHTDGSICIRYKNILFTGDTLFASSCGRTDLYSGSDEKMRLTLEYLKTLPHDLQIYPGHGPASTIGMEVRNNPYMISYF